MKSRYCLLVLTHLVVVLLTRGEISTQTAATLTGRVFDPSGAVLPGVTVTARSVDTGFQRSVVSDAQRRYMWGQETATKSTKATKDARRTVM